MRLSGAGRGRACPRENGGGHWQSVLGQQGGGAGAGRQIPGRAVQPERRCETALPDGPAIKGRNTPSRFPPRFPVPSKCTSHLGFGLGSLTGDLVLHRLSDAVAHRSFGSPQRFHCITKCSGTTDFQPWRVSPTVMPRIRDPGHRTPGPWPCDSPPRHRRHHPSTGEPDPDRGWNAHWRGPMQPLN